MKKIAILTRRAGYNMGSSLQAYAMSKFISNLGYDTTILNYDEAARYWKWRIKPFLNDLLYCLLSICPVVSRKLFTYKYTQLHRSSIQRTKFHNFEREYMPLSKVRYTKSSDFRKTINDYDTYVCGSDQIWNPSYYDPNFLFGFVEPNDKVRTVAYSPSIGVTEVNHLPDEEQELISKIDCISCRESQGANVLSQIVGSTIPVTLDPTLMLTSDDWHEIAGAEHPNNGKEYILTYLLHNDTYYEEPAIAVDFIDRLQKETELPIINIKMLNVPEVIDNCTNLYDCSPSDFLTLIANAKYVCTNSFHCCVFSFQFNKRFYVFEKFHKEGEKHIDQNPRIHTLLKLIDSSESLITDSTNSINIDSVPNYDNGKLQLEKMKELSKNYIVKSIDG